MKGRRGRRSLLHLPPVPLLHIKDGFALFDNHQRYRLKTSLTCILTIQMHCFVFALKKMHIQRLEGLCKTYCIYSTLSFGSITKNKKRVLLEQLRPFSPIYKEPLYTHYRKQASCSPTSWVGTAMPKRLWRFPITGTSSLNFWQTPLALHKRGREY